SEIRHARHSPYRLNTGGDGQVAVMIGIDPHKGSHTAAAIDNAETALGHLRVRASTGQVERLLGWAQQWPERTWAVEGAGGFGYLLAQSSSRRAKPWWMCNPSWPPGSGCWPPGRRTRTTRTTP